MTTVDVIISRLGHDRTAPDRIGARFAAWWSDRAPEATDVLDALAARAPTDPAALDLLLALVDRHGIARPALHRTLIDGTDIDDAEQSTLAAIGLRINQFDGRSRFTTWLHTVADNEAKMLVRSRSRRPSTPTETIEASPFLARLSTLLASRDLIERAFAELPDLYRTALELREIGGLDYQEIAETLGIEVGTVRSRLSRGRALLVTALRAADA